jgi:para-aminobenzoate synthetase component I
MTQSEKTFQVKHLDNLKEKIFRYVTKNNFGTFLDSNSHNSQDKYSKYDLLAATDPIDILTLEANATDEQIFSKINNFIKGSWVFGTIAYDFKNHIEDLSSNNTDYLSFPDLLLFKPATIFRLKSDQLTIISTLDPNSVFDQLCKIEVLNDVRKSKMHSIMVSDTHEQYLNQISKIKHKIRDGDIYELNYCQAFYADGIIENPAHLFEELNNNMGSPFSVYFQAYDYHLLCMSPERYICKRTEKVISQPIKGTIRRGINEKEDELLKIRLANSEKDRAENVMIVDLVRNDFSRVCIPGSVVVEELFGIHTFRRVIQMISTVSGRLKEGYGFAELLRASFPMGSMTGAPKIRSMELIEEFESFKRSWYSGSFGYLEPNGDFDFNVIIRSIIYNSKNARIVFPAGGAIVFDSDQEEEYQETLLKINPISEFLKGK